MVFQWCFRRTQGHSGDLIEFQGRSEAIFIRHSRVSQGCYRGFRKFQGVSRHLRLSGFRRSPEAMQGVTEGFTQKVSSGISEAFQKHFGGFSGFSGSFMDVSKISAMFEDF